MTFSKWRVERSDPIRRSDEDIGRDLDQQAILRLSAAEAEPSAQLRSSVLASFEERTLRMTSARTWLIPLTAGAMIAFVVMVQSYWRLRLPQPPVPLTPVAKRITASPVAPAEQALVKPSQTHRLPRSRNQHRPPEQLQAKGPETTSDVPVAQFDSLLYCDPFSCGDPMQVIRLEVPAASVGRAYRPLARNGFVNAEVIVGADGLTRAVRFTK